MFKKTLATVINVASAIDPITSSIKLARTNAAINARTDALIALGAELDAKYADQTATTSN
jgi:hypothetical protein